MLTVFGLRFSSTAIDPTVFPSASRHINAGDGDVDSATPAATWTRIMGGTGHDTARGIAVYTDLNQRNFNLRIEKKPGQPRCNSLAITFNQTDGFEGERGAVLAEGNIQVNQ